MGKPTAGCSPRLRSFTDQPMIELVCTCDFPSVSLGISPTLGYLVRLERRHEVFVTGRHPKEDV